MEFSTNLDQQSAEAAEEAAEWILALQAQIIQRFMATDGRRGNGHSAKGNGDHAVPGRLLAIGGTDSRYGRRLFINVLANSQVLKFFGNAKELAEVIAAAGYPELSRRIAEGVNLDRPCRVVTKPSEDGRYVNVDRILPFQAKEARAS